MNKVILNNKGPNRLILRCLPSVLLCASIVILFLCDLRVTTSDYTNQQVIERATQAAWWAGLLMAAVIILFKFVTRANRIILVLTVFLCLWVLANYHMTRSIMG